MKVLGIGNAIVDVICKVENSFLTKNNLTKSTMKLVDETDPSIEFVAQGDHFHLYIEVADLAARHEDLDGGGAHVSVIKAQPWGREFVVIDPDGHRIYYAEKDSG